MALFTKEQYRQGKENGKDENRNKDLQRYAQPEHGQPGAAPQPE